MAHFLYVYNKDTAEVIESHDVSDLTPDDREKQKLHLLFNCDFPCDVLESRVMMDGALTQIHPG